MARSSFDFRVLIVPGLNNSGDHHWQTRWQLLHPSFERVEQLRWDVPDLDAWSERLDLELRRSLRPTLIVAHSFGCLATAHRAGISVPNVAGALLVAPADPDKFGVAHLLRNVALPFPSIVIGSTDDPWMESSRAADWARQWGSQYVNAGATGHINADSRLGDWPYGLQQLQRLALLAEAPYRGKAVARLAGVRSRAVALGG